jgi:hydroxymethylpyrimidine pyrophosphatase-like HAD family hydrolase
MVLAIDFDGTIVESKFPAIGKERPFATDTLKMLQKKGYRLILWTYRAGHTLEEAVAFCHERGLDFYAVNKNYPEEEFEESVSRKVLADIYIDDRNLGGIQPWGEIYRILTGEVEVPKKEKLFGLF